MHAYKDAIRRSGGAYILYPGDVDTDPHRGFHEIIPGLGAFAIKPAEATLVVEKLSEFIDQVIAHLLDQSSQRYRLSSKAYEIHKIKKSDTVQLHDPISAFLLDPTSRFIPAGCTGCPDQIIKRQLIK